jgi:hypothetical protein
MTLASVKPLRVLIGGEYSGIGRDAFIAAGHEAMSADLLPTERPGPHYQGDLFDVIDFPWDLAIFHPECTHMSVSGARHFAAKRMDGRQQAAVAFVMRLVRRSEHIPRVAIENPVSILSSVWRKPDCIVQPWEHGHGETKALCWWLKGLPPLKATNVVEGRTPRVHHMSPGPDRWKERSRSYPGVMAAAAQQWSNVNASWRKTLG